MKRSQFIAGTALTAERVTIPAAQPTQDDRRLHERRPEVILQAITADRRKKLPESYRR